VHIRIIVSFFIVGLFSFQSEATNFYIGKNGNDANNGLSPAQAWKTPAPLAVVSFSPGDSVLFERGGVYRGFFSINQSGNASAPIVVSAYGTGAKPVLSGSELLGAWSLHSGNIYKCTYIKRPSNLYVNGNLMQKARFPNSGWLRVGEVIGNDSFKDSTLQNPPGYWVGADVVLRLYSSGISRRVISGFSNQTFTFAQAFNSSPTKDYGYRIENKFSELDQPGEWFCDTLTSTVYLIFPSGTTPANAIVEGSVENEGIRVEWKRAYVVIQNIVFAHQLKNAIYLNNNRFVKIQNNSFIDLGEYGLTAWSGAFNRISSNEFRNMYHGAIQYFGDSSQIEKNTIQKSGVFFGLGNNSYITPAMSIGGVRNVTQYNTVDSAGAAAMIQYGYADTVRNNFFTNSCALSNYNTALQIGEDSLHWLDGNIIDYTVGNLETLPSNSSAYCYGIYLGRNVGLNFIRNNTIANSSGSAIRLNSSKGNVFSGNTMYNNYEQMRCDDASEPTFIADYQNDFQNNILFALGSGQDVFYEVTYNTTATPSKFLNSNQNYLFNPYSEILNYQVYGNPAVRKRYSLERLKTELNRDLGSKKTFQSRYLYHIQDTTSSNLILNSDFSFTITDWSIWPQDASLIWQTGFPGFAGGYLNVDAQGVASTSWDLSHSLINFEKDSCYALSFKLATQGHADFRIEARRGSAPWNTMGLSDYFPGYDTTHYSSFVFKAGESVNPGIIQFTNTNLHPQYKIDDVKLYRVKALYDDPKNNFILYYNPSNQNSTVNLGNGTFYDVQQNLLSSSFILQPYESKIVMRSGTIPNLSVKNEMLASKNVNVYPNPVKSGENITIANAPKGNLELKSLDGKIIYSTFLAADSEMLTFPIPGVQSGIYILTGANFASKLLIF